MLWLKQKVDMIKRTIQCHHCKKVFEYEEPKDYDGVDLMPDGELEDGNWYCSDCL